MFQRMTRGVLVGVLIACQGVYPGVSEAGPVLDFLFGRPSTYRLPVYYPTQPLTVPGAAVTTAASPVVAATNACSPCATSVTAASPVATTACSPCATQVTACSPVTASPCNPCANTSFAPVVQVPATQFQTVQAQVPVSMYRPTTVFSPTFGAPVAGVAGCQTVQVQTQRRPVWDLFGLFTPRPATVTAQPINVVFPQTTVAMPTATVLPGPSAVAAPSFVAPTMTTPSYAAPAYTTPADPNCAGCSATSPSFPTIPTAPVNPGASVLGNPPAATYPAPSNGGAAATTPADQAPSLNAPPATNYQGSSYRPAPPQAIAPPPAAAVPQPSAPGPAITPPQSLESSPSLAPPLTPSASNSPQSQSEGRDLQLIPYPGQAQPANESAAPPLLNHRGRTASLRRSEPWSYAPISWPPANETPAAREANSANDVSQVTLEAPVSNVAATPTRVTPAPTFAAPAISAAPPTLAAPVTSTPAWDDSGWGPIRGR